MSFTDDVKQQEPRKSGMTLKSLFVRLWPMIREEKRWVAQSVIFVLLFAASGRLLPLVFGYAVDHGVRQQDLQVIYFMAAIYLALHILRTIVEFAQTYVMEKLGNRVMFKVREKALTHVQRLPMGFFDRNVTGRIVNRLTTDVLSLGELFNQGFTAIFVNVLELVTIVISMIYLSPSLTVVTLIVAPVAVKAAAVISRKLRHYFGEAKKHMAILAGFTTESLSGARVLHLFGQTEARAARFEGLSQTYRDTQLRTVRQFASLWPLLSFFNLATITSSLLCAGLMWDRLNMSIGDLTAFVLLVQGFYGPIRIMIERYNQFQNSLAGADRIYGLFEEAPEALDGTEPGRIAGELKFLDVTFRYSKSAPPAIRGVNVHIRPGEKVALVGRTGSGKSTFANLLLKFYETQTGDILVDGISIKHLATRALRRRISLVQQDNFIFRGTLFENISLDDPKITEDAVTEALRNAGLIDFVNRLGGLSANIQERGHNLSVGERQLVAFSRTLAFNPDVLILDEATSNVDSQSEALIQRATESVTRGRTSIIIAHRLSTVLHCDRILVFHEGRIVEEGTHNSLIAKGGIYKRLYDAGLGEAVESAK